MNSEFFQKKKMLISEGLTSNNFFLQRQEKGMEKIESKKPFPFQTTTFRDDYASKLND